MASPARAARPDYVPAAGHDVLTPAYDTVNRLALREGIFRPRFVGQITAGIGAEAEILELGCGTGVLTAGLAAAAPAARITGLDGDPAVLARAERALAGRGVTLLEGFSDSLPFPAASFDRVAASLLFHHLSDPVKAATLAEAARVLRPGGSLHIADWGPPRGPVPRVGFAALRLLDGRENTRMHAEGGLGPAIAAAGFGPVELRSTLGTVLGTLELWAAGIGSAP